MEQIIRIGLPIYLLVYLGIVLVARRYIVGKKIGANPLIFPDSESIQGLLSKYFKIIMLTTAIYIAIISFWPGSYHYAMPIKVLEYSGLKYISIFFLIISLIWTTLAQADMKESWRVGIDKTKKTDLVTSGLFRYSRNPIYLGVFLTFVGLFLLTPNAFTLMVTILCYIIIQLHIRLEEEYLIEHHGQEFKTYMMKVRRLV